MDSDGVHFVAICGLGGLGKTTIAQAIYNRIFKSFSGSCFLTDVREEASQGDKGLVSLQKRLLKNILKMEQDIDIINSSHGSNLIRERLFRKKILLILDDVDDGKQLDVLADGVNWFGEGSRVIITSRDDRIVNEYKFGNNIHIYKLAGLNPKNSLQLLCLHAFSKKEPPEKYKKLSHEIVQYAEGLPLILVVLGSFLFGKDIEEWEDVVAELNDIFKCEVSRMSICSYDDQLFEKLMISYMQLSDYAKTIFLDIACYFHGDKIEDKDTISIWEACDLHPRPVIKELTQKHLLNIENADFGRLLNIENADFGRLKFRMNAPLRHMGMRIVLKHSNGDLAKCTRLWSHDRILEALKKYKGTLDVEGILLPFEVPTDDLSFEDFAKMPNLRFLEVARFYKNNLNGDFSCLPSQLRWLRWWYCPLKILSTNFYHEKLVHLDLSMSDIKLAWNDIPENKVKRFQKLKVLILKNCNALSDSPDFSWFPCLERLDLTDCSSLLELSDSICQMALLRSLILDNCRSIKKLPTSMGNLKHLVELVASRTEIEELPDGVGQLEKLEKLDVSHCHKLVRLPTSMVRMRSLRYFDLSNTMFVKFPDDFSQLSSFKELRTSMRELDNRPLPIGMSGFPQPQELNLESYKNLESLPELPSTLTGLEFKKSLLVISDLLYLESLEELLFSDCESLVRLPDLSNLKGLRVLHINGCENLVEIDGLEGTESLEELRAQGCHKLRKLSDSRDFFSSFPWLERLDLTDCCSLLELSDSICQMALLKSLILDNCRSINKLPTSIGNLKYLVELVASRTEIEELPDGVGQLESLKKLDVSRCHKLGRLPTSMGRMKSLRYFDLPDTLTVKLPDDFSQLSSLEVLRMGMMELDDQPLPISMSGFPPQLGKLYLAGYKNLESLLELPSTLNCLEVTKCISLQIISDLSHLKGLEELLLNHCKSLVRLPGLSNLKSLRVLDISGCENLVEIGLEGIESLEELRARGCHKLRKLLDLSKLERLTVLDIGGCKNLENIQISGGILLCVGLPKN